MKPWRILLLIPIVYAAAVVDTSLGEVVQIGRVAPDMLALVAMVWLLVAGRPREFLVAGAVGLFGDLISPGRVGLGMACYLAVGYAVVRLRGRALLEPLLGQIAVVWLSVTAIAASMALGHWLLGEAPGPLPALLARSCGVGAYTAAVAIPLLMVIGWVREPRLRRERKLAEF